MKPQINYRLAKPHDYVALRWPELELEVSFSRAVGNAAVFLQMLSPCCRAFTHHSIEGGWLCRSCTAMIAVVENPWVIMEKDETGWAVVEEDELLRMVQAQQLSVMDEIYSVEIVKRQLALFLTLLEECKAFGRSTEDNSSALKNTVKLFKESLHG